ncbi:MAG: DUF362 domain-containing protein [Spirochaetes bacterium]|nr:DUF362 domain-containing protein [Spirochaetota bacterium]
MAKGIASKDSAIVIDETGRIDKSMIESIHNSTVSCERVRNDKPYVGDSAKTGAYPELRGYRIDRLEGNGVLDSLRKSLYDLGLDRKNFGKTGWNPLGDLVKKKSVILIKPNWVLHENENRKYDHECLVTHPSLIQAILPYAVKAKPRRIIVGDAPLQYCDFDALIGRYPFLERYAAEGDRPAVLVRDFRRTVSERNWRISEDLQTLEDYTEVDVGRHSLLEPVSGDWRRFRVTVYDPRKMWNHHNPGTHRYLVAREILEADLVINMPKLKTHKKAGMTCCLKNLVGINGNKEYLPHHRKGGAPGGDAYPGFSLWLKIAESLFDYANKRRGRLRLFNLLFRAAFTLIGVNRRLGGSPQAEGNWHGNDTIWRTCLDLNRVLLYSDSGGVLQGSPQRRELNIVDAVIAGQGEGPLMPEPLEVRAIIAGFNPAAVDYVTASIIGFDPEKIPVIRNAFRIREYPIAAFSADAIRCVAGAKRVPIASLVDEFDIHAEPPLGWKGRMEK